ncbi:ribonuclease H protein family, partial [Trichomonas vaginalis G3]|uniref:ribonuclease H protein family n=1 Tax=Trichomonas vaginalis (strain ATCC PRA-98 / G3) TaxID=412133 RepID=UPI0021E5D20E
MRQAYGASETMVLSSMLMDFNENSTISFCYSIDGEDKNFISYVEIYDNMTSGIVNYNITLPNSKNDHYLILWGENELGHVLCPYNEIYIIVSQAPELNITNTLLGTYYSHAFIEVDVSVYDDTEGYVYCKIDDGKEFKISKLIQSFYEIEERVLQVEIKEGTLSEGSHSLSIFMRDEFGSDSVAVVHNFEYSLSKQTPELSVESKVKGYTYGYFESIKIKCKAKSFNEGDKISLKIKLNYDDYFTIHEFSSDSTRYILSNDDESSDGILVYEYDLKIPPSDGFYTASIKAVNQDGIESKITFVDFEVRRLPGIEFTQPFRVNYNSDETIVVSGHVVDYDIGQEFDVFYNVDNGNKIFVDRVKIDGEYKSKEFSFTINPSPDVNIHSSKVWLEINNKVIYQTNGNFLVNSPPQISLLNSTQLRNVYYDGDHINLDYKIKDNTQAVVCYKFDSRPETCFKDTVYSYEREYNYRKQILVDQTVLSHDEHTITIYARDEFKMESEIITHRFTLSEGSSPDITIDGFARQYEYNFYESIYIKGSVIDTSPTEGGKVTVYCRFNFSDPIPLHEFESYGHSHNFESYVPVPRNNSKYFIVVYAVDNMGSHSRDFRHDFKVQHKPCIKLHNSIEHSYMPGDNVTIEGFAG